MPSSASCYSSPVAGDYGQRLNQNFGGNPMKLALFTSAILLSAGAAQAGTYMGFDDVRQACLEPTKFQNQIAPKNLQISCEDRGTRWQPVSPARMELGRSRQVIASLSSDKYMVAPETDFLAMEAQVASCPRFKEVLEVLNFTKATSCDEILSFKGSETEFCTQLLDQVREANPQSIQISDTGNMADLCSLPQEQDQHQQERGQRGHGHQRR
jgi:hypothetical protein